MKPQTILRLMETAQDVVKTNGLLIKNHDGDTYIKFIKPTLFK